MNTHKARYFFLLVMSINISLSLQCFKISYGVSTNQGKRLSMEDRYDIKSMNIFGFGYVGSAEYFGLFDGHGGSDVAEYLKNNMHEYIDSAIHDMWGYEDKIRTPIIDNFKNINDKMRRKYLKGGSTAVISIILGNKLIVVHVGDSRIVRGDGTPLTIDHTPKNQNELKRVGKENIKNGRLGGCLAVTRAFGDFELKKYGLTAEPEIGVYSIKPGEFVIMASDGIWDIVSNKEAADFVKKRLKMGVTLDRVARELVLLAAAKSYLRSNIPAPREIKENLFYAIFSRISDAVFSEISDSEIYDDKRFPQLKLSHDNQTVVVLQCNA